mmetsp:Transcript_91192/g.279195  ORF Transcript_91192/g.279195 Transcript_91192/m.279195 type:complete len:235 (+) Transcript_91192:1787-2491(+)
MASLGFASLDASRGTSSSSSARWSTSFGFPSITEGKISAVQPAVDASGPTLFSSLRGGNESIVKPVNAAGSKFFSSVSEPKEYGPSPFSSSSTDSAMEGSDSMVEDASGAHKSAVPPETLPICGNSPSVQALNRRNSAAKEPPLSSSAPPAHRAKGECAITAVRGSSLLFQVSVKCSQYPGGERAATEHPSSEAPPRPGGALWLRRSAGRSLLSCASRNVARHRSCTAMGGPSL